ncbi:MAG TPA: helix-turn-helix domain-containing protein [Spirochaetota bacterium]|nr:helix-turn-helix domain-containing protein [Spirochaetota bacterium]HPV40338.1 helix-turn-helix domain-containing protein [Spirochaetota bacterium]
MDIGSSLKKIRLHREYTIKEVANRINVSVSLLSQIENGKITPSLQSLEELLKFYAINFSDFFKQVEQKKYVYVSKKDSETLVNDDHGIKLTLLASKLQNNALESFIVELKPDASLELARLDDSINGERMILGMSGSANTILDDELFTISKGDSINFKSFVSCRIINSSPDVAQVLVSGMPPLVL